MASCVATDIIVPYRLSVSVSDNLQGHRPYMRSDSRVSYSTSPFTWMVFV
jgi:hypothetical protein